MRQAVLQRVPNCRSSSNAEIPFFNCARKFIARNQVVNENLVHAKIFPLIN